jgi:hypothetical protein
MHPTVLTRDAGLIELASGMQHGNVGRHLVDFKHVSIMSLVMRTRAIQRFTFQYLFK